jgi:hypothetical protein
MVNIFLNILLRVFFDHRLFFEEIEKLAIKNIILLF